MFQGARAQIEFLQGNQKKVSLRKYDLVDQYIGWPILAYHGYIIVLNMFADTRRYDKWC